MRTRHDPNPGRPAQLKHKGKIFKYLNEKYAGYKVFGCKDRRILVDGSDHVTHEYSINKRRIGQ